MGFFECCHYCKPPKRHPGCHDNCHDYTEQKKLYNERKFIERQGQPGRLNTFHTRKAVMSRIKYKYIRKSRFKR